MKLNLISSTAASMKKATTPATAVITTPATTKVTATTKATAKPATTKTATTKATPVAKATPVVAELANIKEEKKYGDPTKTMKMVEKMYLTLTKFENAIEDLWMRKNVLSMEQADMFSVFFAKEFLNECMKKNETGVMHLYPKFVSEVTSIGDNFEMIEDYLDESLIKELLEFTNLQEL